MTKPAAGDGAPRSIFSRVCARAQSWTRNEPLFFVFLAAWLSLEYYALGPASYVQIHDSGDHAIPWYLWSAQSLLRDGVSYWMPAMACGVDRLSLDLSYGHWSELIFVLLPGWCAYALIAFAHYFLAGYFTFRLARDDLGLSVPAATYAGMSVSLYLDFVLSYQGGFSIFPMVVWCLGRLPERGGWIAAAGLGAAYSLFSSFARTSVFCLPMALAWVALVKGAPTIRGMGRFGVFSLCAAAGHLPSIWAMLVNAPLSQRSEWAVGAFSGGGVLRRGLGSLAGNLSGFPSSFFLGLAGLAATKFKRRSILVLAGLTVACAGLGLVDELKALSGDRLGFLKGFNFGRFAALTWFFIAMWAAQGLDCLPRRPYWLAAAVLFMVGVSVKVKGQHLVEWYFQGGYQANYNSPVLRELARRVGPDLARVATFTHGMHPAYANAYGLETTDGYVNIYPKSYQRFWGKVIEPLMKVNETYRERFLGWGLRLYLFTDEVESMPNGVPFAKFFRLNLLSLANTKYIISRHPLLDPSLIPLVTQRPWYSMRRWERIRLRLSENLLGKRYFYIYENRTCLPRFFFAGRKEVAPDEEALWASVASAEAAMLKRTVHVSAVHAGSIGPLGFQRSELRPAETGPDRWVLEYSLDGPGVLVVGNSYSPLWECRINGRQRPIFPAYGTFWGVYVEPGSGTIEFRYKPPYRLF